MQFNPRVAKLYSINYLSTIYLCISHGTKSAMLEGELMILPALGHQNKETWASEAWLAFVLMSQCRNIYELALQPGRFCTMWSFVAKGLCKAPNTISVIFTFWLCKLGYSCYNITKSNFEESFIEWIDIADKNISIFITNNGAATPLSSFKGDSDM